jgi:hypothetical protein
VLLVDEFRRAGVEVLFLNRALGQSPAVLRCGRFCLTIHE